MIAHPPLKRSNFGWRCALTVENFRSRAMESARGRLSSRTKEPGLRRWYVIWRVFRFYPCAARQGSANSQSNVACVKRNRCPTSFILIDKTGSVGQGCWHEDEKQVAVQQDMQVLRQEVGVARASTPDRGRVDRGTETVRRGNHFSCSGICRFWITWIMLCKRTRTKYVRIWIFFSFDILLVTRVALETSRPLT